MSSSSIVLKKKRDANEGGSACSNRDVSLRRVKENGGTAAGMNEALEFGLAKLSGIIKQGEYLYLAF